MQLKIACYWEMVFVAGILCIWRMHTDQQNKDVILSEVTVFSPHCLKLHATSFLFTMLPKPN
jgi:hypothetical protein